MAEKGGALILVIGGPKGRKLPKDAFDKSPKELFSRNKSYEDDEELEKMGEMESEGISSEVGEKTATVENLIREAADVGVNGVKEWPETKRVALLSALAEHCGAMLKHEED